jgi:quaternary ammonium compound-resistance protein SugE
VAWLVLVLAGLVEIVWALALKASDGLSRPWPTALFVAAVAASLGLLAIALRSLPVGTAYAVWTGIGAIGAALAGIAIYGEAVTPLRLIAIAFVATGIVMLASTS